MYLRPHPEELAKQASRRVDATHGLADILRDEAKTPLLGMRSSSHRARIRATRWRLLRMRSEIYSQPLSRGRLVESADLSRRLVPREFGLVQLEFLGDGFGDAGARAQPLVIGFHGRPFRKLDRRRRHGPVDYRDEVGVGDAEMVEQEFATLEIILEI